MHHRILPNLAQDKAKVRYELNGLTAQKMLYRRPMQIKALAEMIPLEMSIHKRALSL